MRQCRCIQFWSYTSLNPSKFGVGLFFLFFCYPIILRREWFKYNSSSKPLCKMYYLRELVPLRFQLCEWSRHCAFHVSWSVSHTSSYRRGAEWWDCPSKDVLGLLAKNPLYLGHPQPHGYSTHSRQWYPQQNRGLWIGHNLQNFINTQWPKC